MVRIKKEGKGQIFKSPFLEVFTKTNPIIHVITYGSAIALFLLYNSHNAAKTIILFATGVILWTLTEYLMHRFLFHIEEGKFQYMIHGIHHEYPRDKERLMMPPLPGLIFIVVFSGFWYVFFRNGTPAFMAGFISGYVCYTFIHYIVHRWKPVKGFRFLWTHHLTHHNPVNHDRAFGVSSPLWDYILRTMPHKKELKH